MEQRFQFEILPQPDDTTCGPTCLHAIYQHYGDDIALKQVIEEVPSLRGGGTLGVMLGNHALGRGYRVTIYTYNLIVFDPTWFRTGVDLRERLQLREQYVEEPKQQLAIHNYVEFLDRGGKVRYEDVSRGFLRRLIKPGRPVLSGLSATYLYRSMRVTEHGKDDDLKGCVQGHFVVLSGYDAETRTVMVADPYILNPVAGRHLYETTLDRLMGAILLGVITYDANLLIIEPPTKRKESV